MRARGYRGIRNSRLLGLGVPSAVDTTETRNLPGSRRDMGGARLWRLIPMVIGFIDVLPIGHAQLIGHGLAIAVVSTVVGAGWLRDVRGRRRIREGGPDV